MFSFLICCVCTLYPLKCFLIESYTIQARKLVVLRHSLITRGVWNLFSRKEICKISKYFPSKSVLVRKPVLGNYTVRIVFTDFAVCDWWRYCKALCDKKVYSNRRERSKIKSHTATQMRHRKLSYSVQCYLHTTQYTYGHMRTVPVLVQFDIIVFSTDACLLNIVQGPKYLRNCCNRLRVHSEYQITLSKCVSNIFFLK